MRTIAWIQCVYFLVTGLWPLVHLPSFMAVTGPKTDKWLVRTVGLLIVAIALEMGTSLIWQSGLSIETRVLAISSALALAGVDIVYVARGVIAKIYLADAVAELALVAAWVTAIAIH